MGIVLKFLRFYTVYSIYFLLLLQNEFFRMSSLEWNVENYNKLEIVFVVL